MGTRRSGIPAPLENVRLRFELWRRTMERLHGRERELEVVFAFDRTRLREVAACRHCSRVANINGCPD